jgi:hypothetical protein
MAGGLLEVIFVDLVRVAQSGAHLAGVVEKNTKLAAKYVHSLEEAGAGLDKAASRSFAKSTFGKDFKFGEFTSKIESELIRPPGERIFTKQFITAALELQKTGEFAPLLKTLGIMGEDSGVVLSASAHEALSSMSNLFKLKIPAFELAKEAKLLTEEGKIVTSALGMSSTDLQLLANNIKEVNGSVEQLARKLESSPSWGILKKTLAVGTLAGGATAIASFLIDFMERPRLYLVTKMSATEIAKREIARFACTVPPNKRAPDSAHAYPPFPLLNKIMPKGDVCYEYAKYSPCGGFEDATPSGRLFSAALVKRQTAIGSRIIPLDLSESLQCYVPTISDAFAALPRAAGRTIAQITKDAVVGIEEGLGISNVFPWLGSIAAGLGCTYFLGYRPASTAQMNPFVIIILCLVMFFIIVFIVFKFLKSTH